MQDCKWCLLLHSLMSCKNRNDQDNVVQTGQDQLSNFMGFTFKPIFYFYQYIPIQKSVQNMYESWFYKISIFAKMYPCNYRKCQSQINFVILYMYFIIVLVHRSTKLKPNIFWSSYHAMILMEISQR